MQLNQPVSWMPDLEDAIQRHPLTVTPTTPLVDAIALLSQAQHNTCWLTDPSSAEFPAQTGRNSCVLVTQGRTIVGILTERDIVRLTAQAITLQTTTVADVMAHPVVTLPEKSVQDIFATLFLFRRYRIRHVPIVDDHEQLVGVISHESIRQALRPANLLRFRRVSDVMTQDVIHAPLRATILSLAQLMATHRVSCIVITQADSEDTQHPVGIVTERDIVQFQALQIDLANTDAAAVMSTPLFLLSPEDSLWKAHQEMQKRRVGRLVVSWNWGQRLGIITQTSLLRVFDPMEMYGVIENLQQTIQQMEAKQANGSSHSSDSLPQGSTVNRIPQTVSSDHGPPMQPHATDDSEKFLSPLNHIYNHLRHIVDNSNLSAQQQQTKLRSVLDRLQQLLMEFNS